MDLIRFDVPPWELVLRASIMYWFLFLLFRFVLRRDAGSVGLADIVVVILIADAAQNGMAGETKFVSESLVTVVTIAGWNYWIDWMSYRYSWFARLAEPQAVALIRHGRFLRANLRREMLTEDELKSQLRQMGVENPVDVKHALLEPDGKISVIRRRGPASTAQIKGSRRKGTKIA